MLAWITGLTAGPSKPAHATENQLHNYYLESGHAALTQTLLVHGAAGLALTGMAAALLRTSTPDRIRTWTRTAGLGAAAISLAQAVAGAAAALQANACTPTKHNLRHSIDLLDSFKLILLAAFVALATTLLRRNHYNTTWLTVIVPLVPLLLTGATAFLIPAPGLDRALAGALVILLSWAAGTAWTAKHRRGPNLSTPIP